MIAASSSESTDSRAQPPTLLPAGGVAEIGHPDLAFYCCHGGSFSSPSIRVASMERTSV